MPSREYTMHISLMYFPDHPYIKFKALEPGGLSHFYHKKVTKKLAKKNNLVPHIPHPTYEVFVVILNSRVL